MYKILMDNCVDSLGIVVHPDQQETEVQWGNRTLSTSVIGVRGKERLPHTAAWKQEQLECLPTIARLAKEGVLQLCAYSEIRTESWKRRGYPALPIGDLFYEVKFLHVPSAIERSYLFPLSVDQLMNKKSLVDFCISLLNLKSKDFFSRPEIRKRFPDEESKGLMDIERFRILCKSLAPTHYPDAFHLWTAEVNGLDYFLTTDKTFINALSGNRNLKLKSELVIPSELLARLGIVQRDPLPFEAGRFYTYLEKPE